MKREAAIQKVAKIVETLRSLSGLIGTPGADYEAVRVQRAWVFGSTAKGSESPNDVDILLDRRAVGRRYWTNVGPFNRGRRARGCWIDARFGAKLDKDYLRRYGAYTPICALKMANTRLRNRMTMVRFHELECDGNFGDIAQTKIMIYPRNDFALMQRDPQT